MVLQRVLASCGVVALVFVAAIGVWFWGGSGELECVADSSSLRPQEPGVGECAWFYSVDVGVVRDGRLELHGSAYDRPWVAELVWESNARKWLKQSGEVEVAAVPVDGSPGAPSAIDVTFDSVCCMPHHEMCITEGRRVSLSVRLA